MFPPDILDNYELAMTYCDANMKIFPLTLEKKPFEGSNGFYDATNDRQTISNWWKAHHKAMIGLATGAVNNIVILDVDCHSEEENGYASLEQLIQKYGNLPDTLSVKTPSGGKHYYFNYPQGTKIGRYINRIASGLDVLGDNGYVVGPFSYHLDGDRYNLYNPECDIYFDKLAEMPEWLINLCHKTDCDSKSQKAHHSISTYVEVQNVNPNMKSAASRFYSEKLALSISRLSHAKAGKRNTMLFAIACNAFRYVQLGYLNENDVVNRLLSAMKENGTLAESDGYKSVISTLNSARKSINKEKM